jgi:hypothetical protein
VRGVIFKEALEALNTLLTLLLLTLGGVFNLGLKLLFNALHLSEIELLKEEV